MDKSFDYSNNHNMVQISKKKLPKDIVAKLFLLFFEVVGKKYGSSEFQEVIDGLFSETEQIMIIKRIAIIYLLMKGMDNVIIADILRVSPSTVCRFSISIKMDGGLTRYMAKLIKQEKIVDFFDDIFFELFRRPGRYGINWSNAWKEKIERDRKNQTGL